MSPFSIAGATPTHSPLTVGDVIHQLPPEVVRTGALPPEQPLSLPPALLENALRSGQAALPVFELYRVCPALFQTPISPQDPRMVPLPASKLPGLIAQAKEGGAGAPGGAAPSPFSLGQPVPTPQSPAGSPFQMQPPAGEAPSAQQTSGSPFSIGGSPAGSPFSMPQPQQSGAPGGSPFSMPQPGAPPAPAASAASPFSLGGSPTGSPFSMPQQTAPASAAPAGSPFSQGGSPAGSPFSMPQQQPAAAAPAPAPAAGSPFSLGGGSPFGQPQQPAAPAPAPAAGSLFSLGGSSGGSPFGQPQQPAAGAPLFAPAPAENLPATGAQPQASISVLFTPQAQQRASTPSDMATPPSLPFGSPFVSAMKEAAPQAEAPPAMNAFAPSPQPQAPAANAFAPSPQPQAAAPGNGAPASGMAKLGFAAVLSGYSMDELGFNPITLPAWITTNVQANVLQEQMSSGNIVVELGLLIDGLSDIGFRNTLTSARRDCRIKLPQNEVFHALTNITSGPAAASMLSTPSPAPVAAPGQMRLSVQPNPQQNPAQQPAQNSQPMFAAAAPQAAPAAPATPMFGAALNPFLQSTPSEAPAPALTLSPAQSSGGPPQFSFAAPAAPAPTPAPAPPSLIPAFGSAPSAFASQAAPTAFGSAAPAEPQQAPVQPAGGSFFGAPAAAAPSAPIQPLASAFQTTFGKPPANISTPSSPLAGAAKPFDPFASSATGALAPKAPVETGFSSAQLLGQVPPTQQSAAAFAPAPEKQPVSSFFAAPAAAPAPAPAPFQPPASFAPALEEIPAFSSPAPMEQPASRGLFSTPAPAPAAKESVTAQSSFSPAPTAAFSPPPAPVPAPAAAPAKMPAVKHSYLGLAPLDTQTDQLLLRALLGTEEKLAAPRVVELLALQTGLSACVCLHGSHVLSHADASKPDAAEFQRQAPDIARQLRGLAPLIGIEGAETFTLNAGGRLLTFCFPGETIIGVLHDDEPSTGMRDKITLIARELSRMLG